MDRLMKYRAGFVADVVNELAAEAQSGICPSPELWSQLNGIYVRDHSGSYWTVGICSRRWYLNVRGRWELSPTPEKSLEGPKWIRDRVAMEAEATGEEGVEPADSPCDPASEDLTGIEGIARDIYSDYEQGLYTSTDATELLQQTYLIEKSGVLWAVGCRSGMWYSFRDGRWRRELSAPLASALNPRRDRPSMAPRVLFALADLLEKGTPLPEPVADPWNPPTDLPETLVICGACGAVNPPSGSFCVRCGGSSELFVDNSDKTRFYPPKAEAEGPRCPRCRKALEEGDQFCPHCGAALHAAEPARCSQCGAELREGALFCARCGTPAAESRGGDR